MESLFLIIKSRELPHGTSLSRHCGGGVEVVVVVVTVLVEVVVVVVDCVTISGEHIYLEMN
jgi:hypothetical protein